MRGIGLMGCAMAAGAVAAAGCAAAREEAAVAMAERGLGIGLLVPRSVATEPELRYQVGKWTDEEGWTFSGRSYTTGDGIS